MKLNFTTDPGLTVNGADVKVDPSVPPTPLATWPPASRRRLTCETNGNWWSGIGRRRHDAVGAERRHSCRTQWPGACPASRAVKLEASSSGAKLATARREPGRAGGSLRALANRGLHRPSALYLNALSANFTARSQIGAMRKKTRRICNSPLQGRSVKAAVRNPILLSCKALSPGAAAPGEAKRKVNHAALVSLFQEMLCWGHTNPSFRR